LFKAGRWKLGEIRKVLNEEVFLYAYACRMSHTQFFTCLKNNGENKMVEQKMVGHG
jgi:hypothetical protein